jgi:protein tyrosine phosphatase (PTP) superfamily phosphohydrolase (DUF442 family)
MVSDRRIVKPVAGIPAVLLTVLALLSPMHSHAQRDAQNEPANFVQWRDGLASSGQPDQSWLALAKQKKYVMIVNLAPPQSDGSIETEGAIAGKQGLVYVNIPVDFNKPVLRDFEFFSAVMKGAAGKNVLVHCQVNLRGSSFVYLYRAIHEGVPARDAAAKLAGVWVPNAVWRQFIEETMAHYGKKAEID